MATVPANDERPPLGEPGKRRSGASTGGMAESATPGVDDAQQRSMERGMDDPMGASTGNASGGGDGPRLDLGGTKEPGGGPGTEPPSRRSASQEASTTSPAGDGARGDLQRGVGAGARDDARRGSGKSANERTHGGPGSAPSKTGTRPHHPSEPRDEGAVESLGRSIGEVVTGSDEEAIDPRRPRR